MQSQLSYNPFRGFLFRFQSALVVVVGFASAFLLGLLLWNLTGTTLAAELGTADQAQVDVLGSAAAPPGEALVDVEGATSANSTATALSPVFGPEVRHWEAKIFEWSQTYGLDPNLIATLMQIESCGNPQAVSSAGAAGLFQVMPFHFAEGEDSFDPDTNARRGLDYLVGALDLTEGHVGLSFAGYNGGHSVTFKSWDEWPQETRRYYRWGTGIYNDLMTGLRQSPTLQEWMAAGGASLCRQASVELGLSH